TVRYLREVIATEFFLFLEAEWTVIGGDDLQMVPLEAAPEFFLMPLFAKRWREDIFRAFKVGDVEVFDRQIQILRASFSINGKAAVPGLANFLESFIAAQVHDVDRSSGHLRQGNRAGHGLSLRGGGPGKSVVLRPLLPSCRLLRHDDVDGASVFGMHANESAIL